MSAAFDCQLQPPPAVKCGDVVHDAAGPPTKCTIDGSTGVEEEHEWSATQALDHLLGIIDEMGTQLFPDMQFAVRPGVYSSDPPFMAPAINHLPGAQSSVDGVASLAKLKESCAICSLENILLNALDQRPRVGYNSGTGEISITVMLEEDEHKLDTVEKYQDCDPDVEEARAMIVQTMLGLCAEQTELEALWTQRIQGDTDGLDKCEPLLANQCLLWFAEQTGVGIIDRRMNLVNQTLRFTIASAANGIEGRVDHVRYADDHRELFQYNNSYFMLTGCEVDGDQYRRYSEMMRHTQHQAFTSMLLDKIWEEVNARNYFPTQELQALTNEKLGAYLHSAVDARRLSAAFTPSKPLRLYLHGTAGVGKSSFTSTIAAALQATLQRFIATTRRVDLIKCPLNAVTPENLQAMLHVQGISDWSIERVLEQTLRRGDVAIFHLEEAPEDSELQTKLFTLIEGMAVSLLKKYPDCRGNLIFVAVSNYSPAAQVAAEYTALKMAPPDKSWQLAWCKDML